MEKIQFLLSPHQEAAVRRGAPTGNPSDPQPSIIRTFTSFQAPQVEKGHGRQAQRNRLARRAFNRVDFLAVLSFWVSFFISVTNLTSMRHVYVFQMLSCLRILRLLSLTSGTSVRSLFPLSSDN